MMKYMTRRINASNSIIYEPFVRTAATEPKAAWRLFVLCYYGVTVKVGA